MMRNTRIVLADDQLLIRAGIRALIENLPGYSIDAECSDGHEAIAATQQHLPDVLLLDIAMPGLSGIDVASTLQQSAPSVRILILSSIERRETIEQALQSGVSGYLLKDFVLDELQQALAAVLAGYPYLSPKIRVLLASTAIGTGESGERLTARQTEILRLVASGMTTKEIARDLGISPKTVEFHRARLMERIGVKDVTGLTRFALNQGLVS